MGRGRRGIKEHAGVNRESAEIDRRKSLRSLFLSLAPPALYLSLGSYTSLALPLQLSLHRFLFDVLLTLLERVTYALFRRVQGVSGYVVQEV